MRSERCGNFAKPMDGFSRGFTNILSLDLFSPTFAYESDHLLGNHPLVYASTDALVLTDNAWDWWWFWGQDEVDDMTNIHTFDISVPGVTTYTGSGRIDGQILNQFSLSEHEGVLRVATTVGQWNRWWMEDPEPMSSSVITLVVVLIHKRINKSCLNMAASMVLQKENVSGRHDLLKIGLISSHLNKLTPLDHRFVGPINTNNPRRTRSSWCLNLHSSTTR